MISLLYYIIYSLLTSIQIWVSQILYIILFCDALDTLMAYEQKSYYMYT